MPGLDRSGPEGVGPMTGGGRGRCNPAALEYGAGFAGGYYARGGGRGRGFRGGYSNGFGIRRRFAWNSQPAYGAALPVDETSELNMLKAEADYMKNTLDQINRRVEELEKT